jgi:hypothetical protein
MWKPTRIGFATVGVAAIIPPTRVAMTMWSPSTVGCVMLCISGRSSNERTRSGFQS